VIGEGGASLRVVVTARKGGGAARMSKELLRRWPKAELHVHLDGCLRPETMLELAREQGVRLPADTPAGLAQALHVKHAKSLEEYLTKYEITLSVMQTAPALERIAYEFVVDAAADGVRYVEVRYSPLLHRPALTLTQAIEAPLAGIRRAEGEAGTKVGLIVGGVRTRLGEDPALLHYVVERAIPLEMCLSSNLHTHTVTAIAEHPFKRYLERGVVVTLNTDGRLVDGISLTDEYFLAHSALGLSRQDLTRVTLNACQSAFLPEYEKVALVSRVQSELEAL